VEADLGVVKEAVVEMVAADLEVVATVAAVTAAAGRAAAVKD